MTKTGSISHLPSWNAQWYSSTVAWAAAAAKNMKTASSNPSPKCWEYRSSGFEVAGSMSILLCFYRVFQLDLTYFEVQDGQLKLTFKFKKRKQHIQEIGTFEFYQSIFKKVTLVGLNSLRQKKWQYSTWYVMILSTFILFETSK